MIPSSEIASMYHIVRRGSSSCSSSSSSSSSFITIIVKIYYIHYHGTGIVTAAIAVYRAGKAIG
jgi:hypothetical protein